MAIHTINLITEQSGTEAKHSSSFRYYSLRHTTIRASYFSAFPSALRFLLKTNPLLRTFLCGGPFKSVQQFISWSVHNFTSMAFFHFPTLYTFSASCAVGSSPRCFCMSSFIVNRIDANRRVLRIPSLVHCVVMVSWLIAVRIHFHLHRPFLFVALSVNFFSFREAHYRSC